MPAHQTAKKMNKIYIATNGADQWAGFLADPVKHWRTGFSARTLAHAWEAADGFPVEVKDVLAPQFPGIEMLLGLPEHQVPLPGGTRPSQNDIWVLARSGGELVSIAVEGKVAEAFGPTIADWSADGSTGKSARLAFLLNEVGLSATPPGPARYQLLHRTASAVIEAKQFCAKHAVMLVHSFSQSHQWFEDYAAFGELFGVELKLNEIVRVGDVDGVKLHLAWVCGDPAYLER